MDPDRREGPDVDIWSDALGSWGSGALWGGKWFQVPWAEWPAFRAASIATKELLPIIVAATVWGLQCVAIVTTNRW